MMPNYDAIQLLWLLPLKSCWCFMVSVRIFLDDATIEMGKQRSTRTIWQSHAFFSFCFHLWQHLLDYDNLLLFWQASDVRKNYNKNNNNNSLQAPTSTTTIFVQVFVNGPVERVVSHRNYAVVNNVPCSLWFPVNFSAIDNDNKDLSFCSTFSSLSDQWWNREK